MTAPKSQGSIFDRSPNEFAESLARLPSSGTAKKKEYTPNGLGARNRNDPMHPVALRLLAEIKLAGAPGLHCGRRDGEICLALYDLHRAELIEWTGAPWVYRIRDREAAERQLRRFTR